MDSLTQRTLDFALKFSDADKIELAAALLNSVPLTFHHTDTFADALCDQTRDKLLRGSTRWNLSDQGA